jgi:hypothetical protein
MGYVTKETLLASLLFARFSRPCGREQGRGHSQGGHCLHLIRLRQLWTGSSSGCRMRDWLEASPAWQCGGPQAAMLPPVELCQFSPLSSC